MDKLWDFDAKSRDRITAAITAAATPHFPSIFFASALRAPVFVLVDAVYSLVTLLFFPLVLELNN